MLSYGYESLITWGVKFMFFKNASPDQVTVTKEGQLQNTPMATIPIPQNQPTHNAEDLVVGEGVVLNGLLRCQIKQWSLVPLMAT